MVLEPLTSPSTLPKPFVFVLMPIHHDFDDIYKFGIKGAADDAGAYAERVDEQLFEEGILDRIFNQISKADVIVADMTGRNPNVFYEVGYAHALGKLVILLTQRAEDIPFDLKHRQHTIYDGKIGALRQKLTAKLRWAISEARQRARSGGTEVFGIRLDGIDIPPVGSADVLPVIEGRAPSASFSLTLQVRNDSLEVSSAVSHVYLFGAQSSALIPCEYQPYSAFGFTTTFFVGGTKPHAGPVPLTPFAAMSVDGADGLTEQFRLNIAFTPLPPSAVEARDIPFVFAEPMRPSDDVFRLRLLSSTQYHDFKFRIRISPELAKPADASPPVKALPNK